MRQDLIHNQGNITEDVSDTLFVRRQKCSKCIEFKPQCFRLHGKLICRECNKAMVKEKQDKCSHDKGVMLNIFCRLCGKEIR